MDVGDVHIQSNAGSESIEFVGLKNRQACVDPLPMIQSD
jgi:hypothetical protein